MRHAIHLLVLFVAGCPVQVPDGRFGCGTDAQCPPGMSCNASGLCVRELIDAGPVDGDVPALDVPSDALDEDAPLPACAPPTLALLTISGSEDDDAPGLQVIEPHRYRVAVSFSGTLGGATAMGFDAAWVERGPADALTVTRRITGVGDTFARAMSADGTLLAGSTGTAMFGSSTVTVAGGAVGFVDQAPDDPLILGGDDPAGLVSVNAVARIGASICAGGTFRGQLDPGDGVTVVSEGDDAFIGCWQSRLLAVVILPGLGDDGVSTIVPDGTGGLYVGGRFSGRLRFGAGTEHLPLSPEPIEDAFVAHLDADLNELAFFQFGSSEMPGSNVTAIAVDGDGLYAVGRAGNGMRRGLPAPSTGSSVDALLVRLDASLVPEWFVAPDRVGYDELMAVAIDACGRPNVAGGLGAPSRLALDQLVPEVRIYSAIGEELEIHRATSGTGYFRGLVRSGDGMVAVGRYHSSVSFSDVRAAPVAGGSDVMILELNR